MSDQKKGPPAGEPKTKVMRQGYMCSIEPSSAETERRRRSNDRLERLIEKIDRLYPNWRPHDVN